jgi:hypothetical protein
MKGGGQGLPRARGRLAELWLLILALILLILAAIGFLVF